MSEDGAEDGAERSVAAPEPENLATFLQNAPSLIQDQLARDQHRASNASVDSDASGASAFSTTASRNERWRSSVRALLLRVPLHSPSTTLPVYTAHRSASARIAQLMQPTFLSHHWC